MLPPPPRHHAAAGKFGQLGYPWLDYFRAAAGISGWGLVGEVKLAVLLLGFATGVSWRGEIGRDFGNAVAGFFELGLVHLRFWKCC